MKAAIYLIGQGSQLEPRPIELQYQRIISFMKQWFRRRGKRPPQDPPIFVDLNPVRAVDPFFLRPYPQLTTLLEGVKCHKYDAVFLDVQPTHDVSPLAPNYDFICREIERAGAEVLNAYRPTCKCETRFCPQALQSRKEDYRDFVHFFPEVATHIVLAHPDRTSFQTNPSREELLRVLKDMEPQFRGQESASKVDCGGGAITQVQPVIKREKEKKRR